MVVVIKWHHAFSYRSNVVYLLSFKVCHGSMLGEDQQSLGLYLTIKSLVLECTEDCLLRVGTKMILYIDIFLTQYAMVLKMSV